MVWRCIARVKGAPFRREEESAEYETIFALGSNDLEQEWLGFS
jgi:hypothetical protein